MPRPPNRQKRVYDALRELIDAGDLREDARLPSVRELAETHDVSLLTVQKAIERLAEQGAVVRAHGRGVFVADHHRPVQMGDSVVLCMPGDAHLWGDLSMHLVYNLSRIGVVPHLLDTRAVNRQALIRQLSLSEAPCYVIQGSMHFPFEVLERPAFENKRIIGVVLWESEISPAGMYRILCDRAAGGRAVARHLHRAGHRHVLYLGTPRALKRVAGELPSLPGAPDENFCKEWKRLGGTYSVSPFSRGGSAEHRLDQPHFLSLFARDPVPTAIFAQFDIGAWLAQETIRRELPQLDGKIEIVGFGDTPWSHAAYPPISSVNLQLPLVAKRVSERVAALRQGQPVPPEPDKIACRLILRDSSRIPDPRRLRPRTHKSSTRGVRRRPNRRQSKPSGGKA